MGNRGRRCAVPSPVGTRQMLNDVEIGSERTYHVAERADNSHRTG